MNSAGSDPFSALLSVNIVMFIIYRNLKKKLNSFTLIVYLLLIYLFVIFRSLVSVCHHILVESLYTRGVRGL